MDFGSCIKYGVLFWISILFAILGIVLVIIGAFTEAFLHFDDPTFVQFNFLSTPAILIFIGVIIFVMAFLGCCGALKENHCMIKTFSCLLLLLFILEVAAVIACYVNRGKLESILEDSFNATMSQYNNNTQVQKSWDVMQHEFQCCGLNGPRDWEKVIGSIPSTCCSEIPFNERTMAPGDCSLDNAYTTGCFNLILKSLEKQALVLGLSAVGISLIQIIVIVFSCALARSIRRNYTTV